MSDRYELENKAKRKFKGERVWCKDCGAFQYCSNVLAIGKPSGGNIKYQLTLHGCNHKPFGSMRDFEILKPDHDNYHAIIDATNPFTGLAEQVAVEALGATLVDNKVYSHLFVPGYTFEIKTIDGEQWVRKIDHDNLVALAEAGAAKEIIICAAIRASDGYVFRGQWHATAMYAPFGLQAMPKYKDEQPHGDDQGFVTSTGRYVTREEAWDIAEAAGQLNDRPNKTPGTLYSEDLDYSFTIKS